MAKINHPIMLTLKDAISGQGFLAGITLSGRALMRHEDGKWWMYGVRPGGIAECFLLHRARPQLVGDANDRSRPERGETGFRTQNLVPSARPPKRSSMLLRDPRGEPRSSRPRDATGRNRESDRRIQARPDSRNPVSHQASASKRIQEGAVAAQPGAADRNIGWRSPAKSRPAKPATAAP